MKVLLEHQGAVYVNDLFSSAVQWFYEKQINALPALLTEKYTVAIHEIARHFKVDIDFTDDDDDDDDRMDGSDLRGNFDGTDDSMSDDVGSDDNP